MSSQAVTPQPAPAPEASLLERISRADERALRALLDRHLDRVYAFVLRRVDDRRRCEVLCEEIWTRALGSLDPSCPPDDAAAWLLGWTRRVLDERRDGGRPAGAVLS